MQPNEPPIIISIGGSLIAPHGIDVTFLKHLNTFIRQHVKRGKRFFLVTGGGKISRDYRDVAKQIVGDVTDEDLDWLGIHATRMNGHLLRTIFKDIAHPRIIENYEKKLEDWKEPVVIGAGWKPGGSTDYCAVTLAKDYNAHLLINLTDIEWLYDKDPKKYKDAQPIKRLTWEELENFVGTTWIPGMHEPFDPTASQLAKKLGLTVIITNGNFNNLEKIINGDSFKGTVVMPYRIDASFYDREYYMGKKGEYRLGQESFIGKIMNNLINYYRAFLIKTFLNPKNCLDVGCGTGGLVKKLRQFGIDAYGVEISRHALDLAESDIKQYLKLSDIIKLSYEKDEFDLVVTFDVLEHLERNKIKQSIDETIRISRKYILHKIYTSENGWIRWFHGKDFSHSSVFPQKFWQRIFYENESVSLLRSSYFKLPSFFESVFLLRKKQ